MTPKQPKRRNPFAAMLSNPLFKQRRVKSKKIYDRNKQVKEIRRDRNNARHRDS